MDGRIKEITAQLDQARAQRDYPKCRELQRELDRCSRARTYYANRERRIRVPGSKGLVKKSVVGASRSLNQLERAESVTASELAQSQQERIEELLRRAEGMKKDIEDRYARAIEQIDKELGAGSVGQPLEKAAGIRGFETAEKYYSKTGDFNRAETYQQLRSHAMERDGAMRSEAADTSAQMRAQRALEQRDREMVALELWVDKRRVQIELEARVKAREVENQFYKRRTRALRKEGVSGVFDEEREPKTTEVVVQAIRDPIERFSLTLHPQVRVPRASGTGGDVVGSSASTPVFPRARSARVQKAVEVATRQVEATRLADVAPRSVDGVARREDV